MNNKKFTPLSAQRCRDEGRKFTMMSVYDYPTAKAAESAGIDALLVGDSLAMTVLGHADTISLTLDEMIHHVKAVARAADRAMVVADMPFLSYQVSIPDAISNAGRCLKEGRADAVKLEGGKQNAPTLGAIHDAGIPVMAHIGLTPQSAGQLGGMKVQGKSLEGARALIEDALALENAGAFAVLMECVPAEVAALVHQRLRVPTISYGAGPACDAQGLVAADVLGLFDLFLPKFSKRYANIGEQIRQAFQAYRDEVMSGAFPGREHQYALPEEVAHALAAELDKSPD